MNMKMKMKMKLKMFEQVLKYGKFVRCFLHPTVMV